jgi:hypothetical protein
MAEAATRWVDRFNYTTLLMLLAVWMLVAPLAGATEWGPSVAAILAGIVFGLGIYIACRPSASRWVLMGALLVVVCHNALVAFRGPDVVSFCFAAATLFYTLFVPVAVVRHALSARRVDTNVIMGALCAYVLLGVAFGGGYVLLETRFPGSFATAGDNPVRQTLMYFSFVTMTTLGYGDVAPVSGFARFLAVLEALVGQVYLVVLLARLVTLHVQRDSR